MASGNRALTRYDNACRALAAAKAVDEVKEIRDQAAAMREYARQAKNKQLEVDATEIRIRAERRIGELMKAQKDAGLMATGTAGKGRPKLGGSGENPPNISKCQRCGKLFDGSKWDSKLNGGGCPYCHQITLAEVGIDKSLADRARKYAAVPDDEWEQELGEWRERVSAENTRVATKLEKRGESEIRRTERKECDIPDSAIVGSRMTCPNCGQSWPEGKPFHG